MDFLIFHPFSLLEPKVIIFINLGLKSIMASHYPLKIDHFGFLQTSKILKNAWEIAFWSFLIFLKLALIFDFSQFQGICTRFKLLWNWIFFILSYFQGWCDTIFLTLFITQGWCVLWSYYTRNTSIVIWHPQIQRSKGSKFPGSKGPRYLKVLWKYELDSKEGPSCSH